jgi:micrococcal nuclease
LKSWIFFFLIILLLFSACSPPTITTTKVQAVIDGDTVVLENGEHVRLIGIDSPEKGFSFYEEARNYAISLMEGKEVKLEKDVEDKDKYDRLLRYIWVDDLFVNEEMIKAGWALAYRYPPDIKYADLFEQIEKDAKNNCLGMWKVDFNKPIPPPNTPTPPKIYVGSKNSDKYHYPDCEWAQKILPENQVWFSSANDAITQGYQPCKVCHPPSVD